MKTGKHQPTVLGLYDSAREREVREEIENFRKALNSYPDHFARDPRLSFAKHLFSLTAQNNQQETAGVGRKPAAFSRLAAHA